ncbi:hypothetical protein Cgig2_010944 [Carnegiea gigantea]|uniref:Uncharacterized protein n=1 Tax=Carnegiea gigantea TaxID=171969 RepID=A0A9Q1K0S3_9CARY|nr:hypothetical protein Cgig2_010944 [Carnegiea gigantea]
MGFPCSLTTDEMAHYVLGNFEWYHREVVFPPRPLPFNYEELYPNLILVVAEEYAQDYEVPELLQGQDASSALEEEESLGSDGQTRLSSDGSEERGSARNDLGMGILCETEGMANHARETFRWHWKSASHPPRPPPKDYWDLCPCFALFNEEEAARDFELPEMVQTTFYAMLLNNAVELDIVSRFMAADL